MLAIALAALAGAVRAGIAGFLKATVGAHEVITTIMLNWIAYRIGNYAFGQGGPLQNDFNPPPTSNTPRVRGCPSSGAIRCSRASTSAFSWALAALRRLPGHAEPTTLGYEVRAVGFNPEAARYGGIPARELHPRDGDRRHVRRDRRRSTSSAGSSAWARSTSRTRSIFIGIAVALLGRNTAVGAGLSALLFGALLNGTSTRNLDPEVFQPELAGNLTLMIQALVPCSSARTC